ncbi:hypothetical protein [Saccharopolyspora phatthalungensis]|uniref:Uncharacterized protein n=1 Tax=Saccharopolyspora phatthalungensis TaxID=664693 RepID=A0A840Q5Z6_9PSEU|nr:hypothetical protein [Saccharopolyspora phatthalungensis]MBB5154148.1 hypothetical protein [Saccharopolyspora phatthalungensis]
MIGVFWVLWISVAALVVLAALGVMPLRGGTGQHAHAGPGTYSVWQLRENATRQMEIAAEPEIIVWPTEDPDRGRHHIRNIDRLCHRLAVAILEHGAVRSPMPIDVCPPRL